jgi:hypothetical protein
LKIFAYEGEGIEFFNHLCARVGGKAATVTLIERAPTRHLSIKDPMFTALVRGAADCVIGPAPCRALCAQGGFVVYADFDGVYSISTPEERSQLEALLMHENFAGKLLSGDEDLKLRLLSALLLTIDHVRAHPDAFISFLYNQVLEMTERGGYWLRRRFIKDAVESCYSYIGLLDYGEAYFSPSSPFEYPAKPHALPPRRLFHRLMQCRTQCDRLLGLLAGSDLHSRARLVNSEHAQQAFQRGQNHYRIYNYGDAAVALQEAVDLIGGDARYDG